MPLRVSGLAVTPRETLNGRFYHRDELAKFDGKTVPVLIDHDINGPVVGSATFSYKPSNQQVLYEAVITDEEWVKKIVNKQFQVSIGVNRSLDSFMCDHTGRDCIYAPVISSINELSIMYNLKASNPETNMVLNESVVHERKPCGCIIKNCDPDFHFITSDKPFNNEINIMTEPIKTNEVLTEAVVQETIPEKPVEIPKVTPVIETPKTETVAPNVTINTNPQVDVEKLKSELTESLKADIIKQVRESWVPKSEITESVQVSGVEKDFTDEEAAKILNKLDDNGYVKIKIDKEDFIGKHTAKLSKDGKLTEAVSTSGTIPGLTLDNEVVVLANGKTEFSVRAWGKFKAIPTGQNTARFYKITVPNAGAINESPTTDITSVTHTLTSIDVVTAVRGWRQNIKRSQFEDYPAPFLNAIKETARIEAIRDEHRLIVQDLAATDHDFGGYTATDPLAFHISGSDGSSVTTPTLEDAAGEFDEDGISFAKRFIQEGHDPTIGPNQLISFLSPRAFESLYTSSGLTNYTMIGNPTITRLGQIEAIYGVDIVVTNELLVANNAYRNLVCVKGKSWALVSQRDMNIQLQDIIKGQTTDVVWTHRIGVDILDNKSYVIVSSIQA